MTGTGTAANPFIPTNWDELKTACETANAYISFPAGGEWNMNSQYPAGAPTITSNGTSHFVGNGFTIKNLYVQNGTAFSGKFEISNLNMQNIFLQNSNFLAPSDSGTRFDDVDISGELNGGFLFCTANDYMIYFNQSGVNLRFMGNASMHGYGNYYPRVYFNNSEIQLTGQTSSSDPFKVIMQNSKLSGRLVSTNSAQMYLSEFSTDSVVDVELSGFASVTGYNPNGYPIVVNASKVGAATIYANFISATSEQMQDAEWLTAHGFSCYER